MLVSQKIWWIVWTAACSVAFVVGVVGFYHPAVSSDGWHEQPMSLGASIVYSGIISVFTWFMIGALVSAIINVFEGPRRW